MSFVSEHVEKRTRKNLFFSQINQIIDWEPIEKELKKVYKRGEKERGCKAYNLKRSPGWVCQLAK